MDTKKLITEAKARFSHHESKLYLTEKYTNKLTFANQGGMWTASPEFIGFLRTSKNQVILQDNYNIPVKVTSKELCNAMEDLYNSVMEEWLKEYSELKTKR